MKQDSGRFKMVWFKKRRHHKTESLLFYNSGQNNMDFPVQEKKGEILFVEPPPYTRNPGSATAPREGLGSRITWTLFGKT